MPTFYAWSRVNHDGEVVATPGDKVTAAGLKMTEDQFQELVDAKAVRTVALPDDIGDKSPHEYFSDQIRNGLSDTAMSALVGTSTLTDDQVKELEKPHK